MVGILEIFLALIQFIVIGFLIVFWAFFLLVERKDPEKSEVYISYESSFPIPDLIWLAPCLLISAIGLLSEQKFGIFFIITAGSAQIFLGLLDLSFNLQHDGYSTKISDTILNIVMQSYCFIFGIIFLIYGWINM